MGEKIQLSDRLIENRIWLTGFHFNEKTPFQRKDHFDRKDSPPE